MKGMKMPNSRQVSESTSLLNLLDELYAQGMPQPKAEGEAIQAMTPQNQKDMAVPPMEKTPLMTEEEMKKKRRRNPFDMMMDESITPPAQITGGN